MEPPRPPAPGSASSPRCLSAEDLHALLHDFAPKESVEAAEFHLAACPACQERLLSISGANLFDDHISTKTSPSLSEEHSPRITRVIQHLHALDPSRTSPLSDEERELFRPSTIEGAIGEFAGYAVLERIAAGGMGIVYRALDPQLNRVVALKILRPSLSISSESRTRFLREARAAAAVVHDHVVSIHAVGEERENPFLVMGYIKGQSLEKRIAKHRLTVPEILRIGAQTARGLAAAHARGLVHRDIKPSNILLENSVERVKLVDFGLAHAADDTRLTREGVLAGTPEFMSPEQVRGEAATTASDQFSLGCVLYTAIHGESPFRSDNTLGTLKRIADFAPIPLNEVEPNCPLWLAQIVERLLNKNPSQRFHDLSTLAELLENCLATIEAGMDPSTLVEPSIKTPSFRKQWIACVAAVMVGVAVFLGWLFDVHNKNASVVPAAHSASGFFVIRTGNGITNEFDSITAAIASAGNGDIIEIGIDGEVPLEDSLKTGSRALVIRAKPGRHPVLRSGKNGTLHILAEGDLTLEGLEFRTQEKGTDEALPGLGEWAVLRQPLSPARSELPRRFVLMLRGSLTIRNCLFSGPAAPGQFQDCIALESCPLVVIENSEFYNGGGAVLTWRCRAWNSILVKAASAQPTLLFSNSFAIAREGFLIGQNSGPPSDWSFIRSGIVSLNLMRLVNKSELNLHISQSCLALRMNVVGMPRILQSTNLVRLRSRQNLMLSTGLNGAMSQLSLLDPEGIGPIEFEADWTKLRSTLHERGADRIRPVDFFDAVDRCLKNKGHDQDLVGRLGPAVDSLGPDAKLR